MVHVMNDCECGCGNKVSHRNNRFIHGHQSRGKSTNIGKPAWNRGILHSEITKDKISKKLKSSIKNKGSNNAAWKGGISVYPVFNYYVPKLKKINKKVRKDPTNKELVQTTCDVCKKWYSTKGPTLYYIFKAIEKGVDKGFHCSKICLKNDLNHGTYSLTTREKLRKIQLSQIEKQFLNNEPLSPTVGKFETECLNYIENTIQYSILRGQRLFSYFPDGLINEIKMIVEVDEKYHETTKCKKRDVIRDETFKSKGYKTFRIKEDRWFNDRDNLINEFRKVINEKE